MGTCWGLLGVCLCVCGEAFEAAGQGQVFKFFTELGSEAQEALLAQADSIDLAEVARLVQTHVFETNACKQDLDGLDPAPYVPLPENGGDPALWDSARKVGAEAISAGRVAAFTVAGGQGTRLGYDGPKGTYPVTPVSKKTLFQVFAEKIARKARKLQPFKAWEDKAERTPADRWYQLLSRGVTLYITEGTKKAGSMLSAGISASRSQVSGMASRRKVQGDMTCDQNCAMPSPAV